MAFWNKPPAPPAPAPAPVETPRSALAVQAAALGLSDEVRARILATDLFDPAAYRTDSADPLAHYVAVGEPAGIAPSARFDPGYYVRQYPDIGPSGVSPLVHYVLYGAPEGRQPLPRLHALALPEVAPGPRPVVLLVLHEATQTGAPILGWSIARQLRAQATVVTVLLKPGKLAGLFAEASDAVVGPIGQEVHEPVEVGLIARALVERYRPAYAILNSVESRYIAEGLHAAGLPFLVLVHEFASYAKPAGSLEFMYGHAAAVVFSAEMVRQSSLAVYPALAGRRTMVLPQGQVVVPRSAGPDRSAAIRAMVRPGADAGSFVVVGFGPIDWRKGPDLFVSAAASLVRRWPDAAIRFVWVGDGLGVAEPTECATYLAEQLDRSHLGGRVSVIAAVDQVDAVYAEADLLLLTSRLDPLPNVAIDAALRGVPIVCFAEASGIADFLRADAATERLVVPYLDAAEAASVVHALFEDRVQTAQMAASLQVRATATFDLDAYVARLHAIGLEAAA